ncbi:putative leucine-rich repeat-containing protein DDB_G0290503 [Mytilus californianus]|uniref:putative leucine-rich repeat-containing protein DDB_G0290503 n=1 Tax=Mytilus californianus TaxID=6549 RepID=UPI0022469FCC|nr:putative leucine-rich repeat-containing protein DDB_G0290503 [Mytilus californianus]
MTKRPTCSNEADFNECIVYLVINILSCHGYLRVCYYTNWSQYRKGIARFVPEDIDVKLCTHLIYAFAKLDGYKLAAVEWNDDTTPWSKGMYERFNNMKLSNPSLKTLLAVGGWNFGSKPFSDMASQPSRRSIFINSTIEFLRKRNFDGLDIDWEYPATRGGPPQDKINLASLMKEMRKAFEEESKSTRKSRLLLTIAVPADEEKIKNGYDIEAISKSSDFINIMTYDFHGAWDPVTGHNSPLFPRSKDMGYAAQKNMNWVSNYWLNKGTPRSKIVIGFPLFGRGFTLRNRNNHDIGSEATGGSIAGPHTSEVGYISNFEVCKMIADGAKVYRDTEQKVPYLVQGDQWIGYDDKESFTEKANWVKQNKFGGVMFWSLALDDFTGLACKTGSKYPMISTVKRILAEKDIVGVNTKQQTSDTLSISKTSSNKTVTTNSPVSSDISAQSSATPSSIKQIGSRTSTQTKGNSLVDDNQTHPSISNGQLKANENANLSVDNIIIEEEQLTASTKDVALQDKKKLSKSVLSTSSSNKGLEKKLEEENKTVSISQSIPQTHSNERATTKDNTDAKSTKPMSSQLSTGAKSIDTEEIQKNNNNKNTSKVLNEKASINSTSLNPDGLQTKVKEMNIESTDKENVGQLNTQNNRSNQNALPNTDISASITTNTKNKEETNNQTEITNAVSNKSQNISKQSNTEELLKHGNNEQQNPSPTTSGSVVGIVNITAKTTENKVNSVPGGGKTIATLKEGTNKGRKMTETSSLKVANGGDNISKRKNETATPDFKDTEVPNKDSKTKSNPSVSNTGLDAAYENTDSSKPETGTSETSNTKHASAKTKKISDRIESRKKSRKKSRTKSRKNSRKNSSQQNGQSSIQEPTKQTPSGKVLSTLSDDMTKTGVKQELKLEKKKSKETVRMRRSNNNFDYSSYFRKRSLLQTTEVGNGANPSRFGSVLSSLLDIVSNFAVGGRDRSVQQSQGSNTGGRRIEARRISVTPSPPVSLDLQRRFGARRRLTATPRPSGVPNSQRRLEARRRQTVTSGPSPRLQQALRLQQRTNARQNQQTSLNAVDPNLNTGQMQNQRQKTNIRQDQQANANAVRIANRRQAQNQRTNSLRQGTQVSSNAATVTRNRGQLQTRLSTRTRTQSRNGTPESIALFPSVESANSGRTNTDISPTRPTQMNSVMRQRNGNAVQNNEIRLLQTRRRNRLRNDNAVRTNNILTSKSVNGNRLTVSRDNILENRSTSLLQRIEDATRQRGATTRLQNSIQNNPNTNQLRDSFLNQIPDLLDNPPINTLDATRLQTALLRTQQRNANQNDRSIRRNSRRPPSNRLQNLRPSLPQLNNLNEHSLLNNNQIFRNQLPQLGAELDVTELGILQGIPTASALGLQPINPTMGIKQSTENGRISLNNITSLSNDQQSDRGQQPVRNLGVQPNIDAKRIMQNDMISRQTMLEQQNRITGGDNQVALLERLLSRQVLGSTNGLTRKELNEMTQLQGMISNQLLGSELTRNNVPRRLSLERINGNSLPTFNQIVPLARSAQPRHFDSLSSTNSILPKSEMEQKIGNEMLVIPNKLAQRQRNKLSTTQGMTPTSNSLNSLRLEDLKLGADNADLSMNSVLNQLQSFKSQTSSTLPFSLKQQQKPLTRQTNITALKTTSGIKPMAQNPSSKQTGNIANILKDRFPQLNANQITALTNEIKRQVKSVVKSNFSEKVRDTLITMPSQKTSGNGKPSASIPQKITEKFQPRENENIKKLVIQEMEPKRSNSSPNFNPIKGLEMLSPKRSTNVGNTVNLEQLRQELMRSGLPGNLVIQINPSPLLNGRSDVNTRLSSGRLGVTRGTQVPSVDVPIVRNQMVRRNNNILLRNPFRKQPRVPLALITTTPTPQQKIDAIQSPHELIIKERGKQAIELSNLPSTPSSSPRQQFRASNQTVVLGSRSKAKIPLPKSEVLWKWQV